jgi:hypothetical protein
MSPRLAAVQGISKPVHPPPGVGRLSNQIRPTSRSNIPENLLKHHPPQHQEHSETDENAMKAPTDLDEPTSSNLGLSDHVIYPA